MRKGTFLKFYLPWKKDGQVISATEQATSILNKAKELIDNGGIGVLITYSANYGQTRTIDKVYSSGKWLTGVSGAHQAQVMTEMEHLMGGEYSDIQDKVRIGPITTMNAYDDPVDPFNEFVLASLSFKDLERLRDMLEKGWDVLGWQNQQTVHSESAPFAVGEGVATLPPEVTAIIQSMLKAYSRVYG